MDGARFVAVLVHGFLDLSSSRSSVNPVLNSCAYLVRAICGIRVEFTRTCNHGREWSHGKVLHLYTS